MNILIPDSWLREHLETKATPREIAQYLSLSSQSVEKLTKKGNDWLYEIEITTNRPDCLSVYGIARELAAILPRFGLEAQLKEIPEKKIKIPIVKKSLPLEVKIKNPSLCPRFTALIFDKITVKPSPKIIRERLEKSGIRALNNVVDISNYLMFELGQPMHTFDYDKIKGAKMILREAAEGEKITTLDKQTRPLPKGTIIIEDGEARIIDLCGIMGGANSEVDQKTKRVLLFVQTYNSVKIRQTCQALGFRTEAASRFEKGVDPEGVVLAMKKATVMFKNLTGARVASRLIDIYPHPPKRKKIVLTQNQLNKVMGIKIKLLEAKRILKNLGFTVKLEAEKEKLAVVTPHWRHGDIALPEDLIEEIARVYGYHNLPCVLPKGEIPQKIKNPLFNWENQVKEALKFWGFTEIASYSMISLNSLQKMGFKSNDCLKISNPLTENFVYMRPSLIPSLLETIAKNQAEFPTIQIFELAHIYLPTAEDKLPDEISMLTGAITGNSFYQIKGVVEALLDELRIKDCQFKPHRLKNFFHRRRTAEIIMKNDSLGVIGEINPLILASFEIKNRVAIFDLNFEKLIKYASTTKKYIPIPQYPPIIEDLAFFIPPKTLVGEMIQLIKSIDSIIQTVELLDSYRNTRTFRITYQSPKKTLTDKEVEKIRKKIIKRVKEKFGAQFKLSGR